MANAGSSNKDSAGRVKDAHGRVVSQLDPVVMHLTRRTGLIPDDVLHDIARDIGFGMTKGVRVALCAWIVCSVSLVIAVVILFFRLSNGAITTGRFALSLVPYCGVLTVFFAFWSGARNTRHQRIKTVMLRHQRCPHCGYDIRGLPTDPGDGATVCPECGCAWRLDGTDATGDRADG
ncbi:MAG: hypothetical protein PVI86_01225 [Phycisphaerae bacterium]